MSGQHAPPALLEAHVRLLDRAAGAGCVSDARSASIGGYPRERAQEEQMPEEHVTMFGPRRVGKTSLLASMYHAVDEEILETDLRMQADPVTGARLQRSLEELMTFPERLGQEGAGVSQDDAPKEYRLAVRQRQEPDPIEIVFKDFPGGYIQDPGHIEEVQEWLSGSRAIIIAIDTPALFASRDPKWKFLHQKHNDPRAIHNFLFAESRKHGASGQLPNPRLMLFVPLKCEWCLQDEALRTTLPSVVKQGYKQTFELLEESFYRKQVVAAITPVQTVGSLLFDGLTGRAGPDRPATRTDYEFQFRRRDPDADFEPADVEQPLRYLLQFILVQYLTVAVRARAWEDSLEQDPKNVTEFFGATWKVLRETQKAAVSVTTETGNRFLRWAGASEETLREWSQQGAFWGAHSRFFEAAMHFADGTKRESPFEVVQNEGLLRHGTSLKSSDA